jgi:4-carboxymuconolactone decarboxylase
MSDDRTAHERGLATLQAIAGPRAGETLGDWSGIAPDMERYIVDFVAGDILSRPGLDPKTRQLLTVAALTALATAPAELEMHLGGALRLGWTRTEVVEAIVQMSVFAGFPAALGALAIAKKVFAEADGS